MGDISIKGRSPLLKGGRVDKAEGGRTGFQLGLLAKTAIKKGTKIRDYYAKMKRAHRLRQKNVGTKERILKERAGRRSSEAFHTKYMKPRSQETKKKWSQGQHPKTWRRKGIT